MTPTRITLSRAKGWRKPEGAIVVSRPSIWGNPWKPGKPGMFWLTNWLVSNYRIDHRLDAQDCVNVFEDLLSGARITSGYLPVSLKEMGRATCRACIEAHFQRIRDRLPELRGHDLCCWCKPGEPCHGDVLIRMANA